MHKEQLRQLIADSRLDEAVELLKTLSNGARFEDEVLMLASRLADANKKSVMNTISPSDLELRRNQIAQALLQITRQLPDDAAMPADPAYAMGTSKPTGTGTGTGTGGFSAIRTGTGDGGSLTTLTGTGDGGSPTTQTGTGDGTGSTGAGGHSKLPFWFSLGVFAVLLGITLLVPGWWRENPLLARTLLALAAGGVAATLPGFLNFEINNFIKAGGALAAFVLVFLVNPPKEEADIPTSFSVQLRPLAPSTQYPPLKNVELELWNKNEWLKGKFSEDGVADFKNLSPDIIGQTVALRWKAEYYRPAHDSLRITTPAAVLEWAPDGSLERVYGKITDPTGMPLPGVAVEVEGILDTTDARGNYDLRIPPALQKTHYLLSATAKGYQPKRPEVWPATGPLNFAIEK